MLMFNLFDPFWDITPSWGDFIKGFNGPVYINVYTNSTEGCDGDCDKKCSESQCVPPMYTYSGKCNQPAQEVVENHNECAAIRKEFQNYINSLDNYIFNKTCKAFTNAEIDSMNDVIYGHNDDKEALEEAVKTFKAKCNEIITDKIMALKSQMV